ncbi:MAG TPA: hypothetical protein HA355_03320 [Methanosphaera sp.]|nr:hypothetical protein [Methanosphaera sp.]
MKIIIAIVGLLITAAFIGWGVVNEKIIPAILGILTGIIFFLVTISIVIVPTGYMGIKSRYQQIQGNPLTPGTYFTLPIINQVDKINCKQQEASYEDKIWGESSERTPVYAENIKISFQINPEKAAWIWANVEEWDYKLLKGSIISTAIKRAAVELPNHQVTNRSYIEPLAMQYLQEEINKYYKEPIINIYSVNIGNMDFSEEYNAALEQRDLAKLEAENAKYVNEKKLADAEAETKEAKIKSDAEIARKKQEAEAAAEREKIAAEAEAESNRKIAESLTPELIELKRIDVERVQAESIGNWRPSVVGGNSVPMLDINSSPKESKEE